MNTPKLPYYILPGCKQEIEATATEYAPRAAGKLPNINFKTIVTLCCHLYKTNWQALQERTQKREVTEVRNVIYYLAKKYCPGYSHANAAKWMRGGHDHSTVVHSIKNITERMSVDETFRRQVNGIELRLHNLNDAHKYINHP